MRVGGGGMHTVDVVDNDEDVLTVDEHLLGDNGLLCACVEPVTARKPGVREESDESIPGAGRAGARRSG